MELDKLPKLLQKSKKRIGRGAGSGRGKTAGRGTKGQKAREKVKLGFEGGQTPLIKRLPQKRGLKNYKPGKKPVIVNLKYLNLLPPHSVVDTEALIKAKIVDEQARKFGVKILGNGQITVPLQVLVSTSRQVAEKIKAVGGKLGEEAKKETEKPKAAKTAKVTKVLQKPKLVKN